MTGGGDPIPELTPAEYRRLVDDVHKKLTPTEYREGVAAARQNMPTGQRATVDDLAEQLVRRLKQRNQHAHISPESALEVLANIGILLNATGSKQR